MIKKTAYDILFILIVAAICHVLFSKYGFNPTDEGTVLSVSDRLLHGQIPHVDFSSMRPVGYAYLHIPELLVSKNYFFLVSRFVFWLEQISIAYFWIRFLVSYTKSEISTFSRYTLILLCFIFNVHYFLCNIWHTIDGLLMCMIGLNLIISEKKWDVTGFIFIGFAALCKQNYLVVLPFTLYLLGRKNLLLKIVAGLLPILLYVAFIAMHDGLNDLSTQLSGHNELIKVGILSYLSNPLVYIGIMGGFIYSKLKINRLFLSGGIFLFAIILLYTNHYHGKYVFLFPAILCGEMFYKFTRKENILLPFITLIIAWSVSISVGYNSPALFAGGIISLLFFYTIDTGNTKAYKTFSYAVLLIACIAFYTARTLNIYREPSAKNLTYSLDHLVEGAYGIYTDKNTYDVLKEVDSLKSFIPNLIIIPDFTACNILHAHKSKLLTEWPNKTEIPNATITAKVTSIINNDSTIVFAVAVFQTALLKDGFTPQENRGLDYPIIKWVKERYPKTSFTKYFELRKM